jgi:hypothetical protein
MEGETKMFPLSFWIFWDSSYIGIALMEILRVVILYILGDGGIFNTNLYFEIGSTL